MTSTLRAALRAILVAVLALPLAAAPAAADSPISRTAGEDRIQTAVEASEDYRQHATDAVLATAFSFPDALAAGALTNRLDAPLLLTGPDALPQAVADELARLRVNTVWILGGPQVVSDAVEGQLADLGYMTRRLSGQDRYETAGRIAEAAGPSATGEVVLALGEHDDPDRAWPDAVASGALAATPDRVPTLLTRPEALPAATEASLGALGAEEVIILGGETVVAPAVESRLRDLGYATRRVVEDSRYDTSAALAADALERFDPGARPAVFASGRAYPDALAAGSLAASLRAPLLLVPPRDRLPAASEQFLRANADRLDSGVVVGGPASADDYVVAQLAAAIEDEPAPAVPPPADGEADRAEQPMAAEDPPPAEPAVQETFTGEASWYGPGLEGNQTANGERFDPSQLTAAHMTLPFDSIVRVTNLANGQSVEVRINDRGPYHSSRVLDVSSAAADVLGMKADGVAQVRCDVLSYGG
ncbi:septal ring lytic transglycosylase RlpA family protein [Euzebya sp.]|uniref:septal ring lytic transglycosylase RlpA family protein n=1 Tax=Euzebya sp. TaxID=1971409 RepID=UPI00351140C4